VTDRSIIILEVSTFLAIQTNQRRRASQYHQVSDQHLILDLPQCFDSGRYRGTSERIFQSWNRELCRAQHNRSLVRLARDMKASTQSWTIT
jgi:hypothetical protein